MPDELFVSASGAKARLRQLEVVSNNLANANTVGFRRDQTAFSATLNAQIRFEDGPARGADAMSFVEIDGASIDTRPGTITRTGSPLDVAIQGEGYFELLSPEGPRYTRAGDFSIGANRQLSTKQGIPVAGDGGPIELGDRPVEIVASGEIVDDQGQTLGRLKVVEIDAADLVKEGSNRFTLAEGAVVRPLANVQLAERSVEGSNVQTVRALAELMMIQRSFEASLQTLQASDGATQALLREISQ